ncbi:MAG: hypothetical protein GOU98_04295 [Candidatus Altiarchaeota archaeon]|nr:hypothetical protein [Candidatus Altiarchaeota archaeon]
MDLTSFVEDGSNKLKVQQIFSKGVRMIYQDALDTIISDSSLLDKLILMEDIPSEITSDFLKQIKTPKALVQTPIIPEIKPAFKVIKNYDDWEPINPQSFWNFFLSRYKAISQMLWKRPNLKNTVSIGQLSRVKGREDLSIIGMVRDIRDTNDGRRIIKVEDLSGSTTVIIPKNLPERGEIIPDEIIGLKGQAGRGIFFANAVVFPDIPQVHWPVAKRSKILFLSDNHVGSKKYLEDVWDKFVSWINEHKEISYVLIAGDLVDGIGMYKNQDKSLEIDTIEGQMEALAKYLKQIRKDVKILLISGNHDPNRDSEPQPAFPADIGKPLKKLDNLEVYSNPAWVEIEGITILMYHGTSLDSMIDAVEPIRSEGYQKPFLGQKHLLKKRHLSPIFGRNKIFPDKHDFMVINKVPHVFHTGHVHKFSINSYRGVKLISTGTFQDTTNFQEKLGHVPSPGKFIVMDLSDGSTEAIDFSKLQ